MDWCSPRRCVCAVNVVVVVGDANEDFDDNNHCDTDDYRHGIVKMVQVFMIAVTVVVVVAAATVAVVAVVVFVVVVVVVMVVVMMK